MLDIPSISAIVVAIGVMVGVVLAVLQLRDLVKTRQADLFMRLYLTWSDERLQEARQEIIMLYF